MVTINECPTRAPLAVAEALATAGINADVSVARTMPPRERNVDGRPFNTAYEVRPPVPTPLGFTVEAVPA